MSGAADNPKDGAVGVPRSSAALEKTSEEKKTKAA